MTTSKLPPHLQRAYEIGHAEPETWVAVAQLELYGERVEVWRLQLGNQFAPGFGEQRRIYATREDSTHATTEPA